MRSFAVFSTANLLIAKAVICCGHVVMALNRFTAFYLPIKQEQLYIHCCRLFNMLFEFLPKSKKIRIQKCAPRETSVPLCSCFLISVLYRSGPLNPGVSLVRTA
ncbi:hypothetical protein Y032_0308g2050 [Ancylostoma ceylanicum]|uniref:Uncharacterized protein n=1 Tax=Ancylostoma ceylanicum TaxID=53326 RepID=A0A016S2K4_9BILA|nr:hypothetical protein Y032_0308g2050 [Ancylostoma ceylanicum]